MNGEKTLNERRMNRAASAWLGLLGVVVLSLGTVIGASGCDVYYPWGIGDGYVTIDDPYDGWEFYDDGWRPRVSDSDAGRTTAGTQ